MERPWLSIVTVTKNDVHGFARTKESLENLIGDTKEIEWIIINAGESIEYSSSRIELLRMLTETDSSPFEGMNKGLQMASGVYINFLNSGDVILNGLTSEEVIHSLELCSSSWAVAKAQKEIFSDFEDWKIPKSLSLKFWLGINSFPHQSTFYRTRILRKIKGFNQFNLAADYEMSLGLLRKGKPEHFDFKYSINSSGGISDRSTAHTHSRNIVKSHRAVYHFPLFIGLVDYFLVYGAKKISEIKSRNNGR